MVFRTQVVYTHSSLLQLSKQGWRSQTKQAKGHRSDCFWIDLTGWEQHASSHYRTVLYRLSFRKGLAVFRVEAHGQIGSWFLNNPIFQEFFFFSGMTSLWHSCHAGLKNVSLCCIPWTPILFWHFTLHLLHHSHTINRGLSFQDVLLHCNLKSVSSPLFQVDRTLWLSDRWSRKLQVQDQVYLADWGTVSRAQIQQPFATIMLLSK